MQLALPALLSSLALLHLAAAIPPACLLGAVNDQQNLGDIKSICSGGSSVDVQRSIGKLCGDMADEAFAYFAATCQRRAAVSVSSVALSTSTSAAPATGTHSSTDVLDNPTPATATASPTSSNPAATNGAGALAAVAVAAAGLVLI